MTDLILFEIRNGVATITLNRPDKLNALSADLVTRLVETLEECRVSEAVKVIVVTGAGRAFSSGGDRSRFEDASVSSPAAMKRRLSTTFSACRASSTRSTSRPLPPSTA
jgi:2-(1,2-epoxy-1,2-dihydrophenyl)acetyl-CoA isomerase